MLKGSQKKIIVVKTADSSVFEEAHFILRNEYEPARIDMVAEANRIIGNCEDRHKRRKRSGKNSFLFGALFFIGGGAASGAFFCAIYAVFRFFM